MNDASLECSVKVTVYLLLWTGMASWSFAQPTITEPPRSAVREVNGSVHLECSVSESYQNFFEWRRFQLSERTSSGDFVYSTYNNAAVEHGSSFPAERFHRVGLYDLNITSLTASDGAMYKCGFNAWNLFASANVFVIGTCSLMLLGQLW